MNRYSKILAEVYTWYREQPVFDDWSRINDIGLPLAYLSEKGYCKPNFDGEAVIEQTWESLCELLDLDPAQEWKSLEQMFAESPLVKE